jgi:Domain of unknown function (DUF1707)
MAFPGNERAAAAAGHGHLRAAHADREQVVGTLKTAFVQGMLGKDEFDLRVGRALASRTYAELAALTDDLPAVLAADMPAKPKARARSGQPLLRPSQAIALATALYAGTWVYALLSGSEGINPAAGKLLYISTLAYLCAVAAVAAAAVELRRDKRTGQRPRRPGNEQAHRRLPPAGPGRPLPHTGRRHRHPPDVVRMRA